MDVSTVERALRRMGEVLEYHREVDLLLVGGAAGMLTGVLPPGRTTTDCDVMVAVPPEAIGRLGSAAEAVAAELGLAPRWLNSDVQLRLDVLPDGWQTRKIWIGAYGRLNVFAASRPDLIAMKVVAGRAVDLDDLRSMRVRTDEAAFVRAHLESLAAKGTSHEQVVDALDVLDSLELTDDE